MKIGLQVYTIREHLQTPADFADAMRKVRAIGYEHVELAAVGPIDVREQKRVLDGEGLHVVAMHTPLEEFQGDLAPVIDRHRLFDCEYAVVPWLPVEYHNADGLRRFARAASEFGRKMADAGFPLVYHNHSFEFERYEGRAGLEILFSEADPKALGSELDTYWVQHGGGSPAAWIRKLSGRVPILHCKDMILAGGQQHPGEVGEGNLEWPDILAAAKKAGTKWLLVEQDVCRRPAFESIAISFRNLRRMLG